MCPGIDPAPFALPRPSICFELALADEGLLIVTPVVLVCRERVSPQAVVVVERGKSGPVGQVEPELGTVEAPTVSPERLLDPER